MNMQTLFPYIKKNSSISICPATPTWWLLYYFLSISHIPYTCSYNIFKLNLCYSGNETINEEIAHWVPIVDIALRKTTLGKGGGRNDGRKVRGKEAGERIVKM